MTSMYVPAPVISLAVVPRKAWAAVAPYWTAIRWVIAAFVVSSVSVGVFGRAAKIEIVDALGHV